MKANIASLVLVVAAAGAASILLPTTADRYLKLDRTKRAVQPASDARKVMERARNTRSIPINARLTLRRVAPGSPDGPVDLHHQPWDWVEVYNRSDRAMPLQGYSLSDDPDRTRKYRFPAIVIPPQSGCRVWLTGFASMNSVWSPTPTDVIDARGWKPTRQDDLADRFTYMWQGFMPPRSPPLYLQWPVHITEPGRYAIWLHAGAHGDEPTSQLHIVFREESFDMHFTREDALSDVQLVCPTSADGYWDLPAGTHAIHCGVVGGKTLMNHVAVFRYGEPFGAGQQDLYADIKLKQGGEFIGLFDPHGVAVDHINTPALPTGMMFTRDPGRGADPVVKPVNTLGGNTPSPPPPRFDVPEGSVPPGTRVTMLNAHPNATVHYTLDGAAPDRYSPRAIEPIVLQSNTVLRARTLDAGGRGSAIAEATYWVEENRHLPILSIIADPELLYDFSYGILYNTSIRGIRSERRCHITLIETNGQTTATAGGIRIQGRTSRETSTKRNFRFVFRERYGQPFWPGTLFEGPGPPRCRSVVATGRSVIRNQLGYEMMRLANVPSPRSKPVRLFVNGQPYGIYLLVEDVQDPTYLESVFGHLDLDVIKEKTFNPVKWGSRKRFEDEILPYTAEGDRQATFEVVSGLFNIDQLARWYALLQVAGIDDNGQGYFVRNHRAEGPPWSIITWDFDHAFTIGADRGWPMPQGYRSRLLLKMKNNSQTFMREHYFPAMQLMLNHVVPISAFGQRIEELQATYSLYLDEEFQALLNQRSFDKGPPDRDDFMALRYYNQWDQLLHFANTRLASIPVNMGSGLFGGPPLQVQIDPAERSPELSIDSYPARRDYLGYYYPGTELSVGWMDPDKARPLAFEINGIRHISTEFRTNVSERLRIRIRDTDS